MGGVRCQFCNRVNIHIRQVSKQYYKVTLCAAAFHIWFCTTIICVERLGEEEGREKRKEKNIASGDPGMPDSLVFLICELVFSENTVLESIYIHYY